MAFLSIGTKLIILVLGISLISIAISTGMAFNLTDSIIKTNVEKTLQEESQARGEAVSSIIQTRINTLKTLAENDIINDMLLQLPSGLDDVTFQHLLEENKESITNEVVSFQQNEFDASLRDLKIVNNRGKLIYSLSENLDSKLKKIHSDSKLLTFIQSENKERLLRFVVPIKGEGGNTIGSIIATTDSTVLDGILLNRFGLQETGEVYLVNRDKLMVSESLFIENAEFNQKVDTEPVRRCFEEGQSVSGLVYPDYRNVDIFGVSYCQKELGYVLLTEVDESVILEPIYNLQEKIIVIGGILMVIATIVTYVLSRRLSQPILKLRDATNRISEGEFDTETKVQTNDEIGQLSKAFDSMTKTLNETISAISRRNDIIKRQEDILQQFSQTKEDSCVCLVDIIGSLKIAQDLAENKKKKYYKIFTDTILDKIKEHKGISVKFINDAILFYFPSSKFDDVFTTSLNCCLDIAAMNQSLNDKMEKENLPGIGYRISLTYGKIDIVSGESASVEDIFGEPVSLAFKINHYAPPNFVIIEKSLYDKIKEKEFEFTKLDKSLIRELEYDVYLVSKK